MMEADMKAVSIGTKSKSEVLQGCLQQMEACFRDVSCSSLKHCMVLVMNCIRYSPTHLL
jgi:hypothetical protein